LVIVVTAVLRVMQVQILKFPPQYLDLPIQPITTSAELLLGSGKPLS
jgi:hypothetical protein